MLENCDKIMHFRFNVDAKEHTLRFCALDVSKLQRECITLSQFSRKKYK